MAPSIFFAFLASIALLAPPVADAGQRKVRIACRDAAPLATVVAGTSRSREAVCDVDRACDGRCTFAFCSLNDFVCAHHPECDGPGSGVCTGVETARETITLPTGARARIDGIGLDTQLVLRCLPPRGGRCECGLGGGGEPLQCGGACDLAGTSCIADPRIAAPVPVCRCLRPCAADADCDDGDDCTSDACDGVFCSYSCKCVGPLGCCPGPACEAPAGG